MLRRLSSQFKKDKDKHKDGNGNGNGNGNGKRMSAAPSGTNGSSSKPPPVSYQPKDQDTGSSSPAADTHVASREDVEKNFKAFGQLIHASLRPMPTQTGDGTYLDETPHHASLFENLSHLGIKDVKTLLDVLHGTATGELVDDKTMLMERVIQLVSALPQNSKPRFDLTNAFVGQLWDALEHPPQSLLGKQFQYRSADGSYNNVMVPKLGAANTNYARSVRPLTVQPTSLPDPGVIFDCLFARNHYREHPNKVSSVLFYWASIIIHDLFQTDHIDYNLSQTSSYLDLSPLYGDTQDDQDKIRTFKDGKLKADCFSEHRLLTFPPGCGVILIMFNRFHNYVVEQLAIINENGRFTKPNQQDPKWQKLSSDMCARPGLSEEKKAAFSADKLFEKAMSTYDNDLFQTGRLITCGLYINITLGDYLRTIVNLNRSNTTWTLDPRVDMTNEKKPVPWGVGNQVSAEFNLVYRWHSAISKKDEEWTEQLYLDLFQKPSSEMTMESLLEGLKEMGRTINPDPQKRPFAKLTRDENGRYDDDKLVEIMVSSIEDCAGAFGANNVPKALKSVDILGMLQARTWNLGTLNEFRKFFKLAPHKTFESINKDPAVAEHLKNLYGHPDFVEMYPGIVAEEAKEPMIPGVGIAPTYTISRAILSDAVVLVRGDRFYTHDYNAKNLTNWGYKEVQYDLNVEQGCVFTKLFLRAFPNHFKQNSIYAHYPMTVPSENHKIMTDLGRVNDYDYSRPTRLPGRINLTSYGAAKYVLTHQDLFHVTWGDGFEWIWGKGGRAFMLSGDGPGNAQNKKTMATALYKDKWEKEVKEFYEYITLKLLHEKSFKLAGVNEVDITRDVGNLAHIHFASNVFSLPLKTEEHPRGIYTEHEMYQLMALMFICIFFDLDPVKSFALRQAAKTLVGQLTKVVEAHVKTVNMTGLVAGIADTFMANDHYLKDYGVHMVRKLLATGMTPEEVTYSQIMPTAGAMVANQAQVFTQCLDFYLSDKGKPYLPEINRLAKMNTPEADRKILGYAMEGIRLNGTFGLYRKATKDCTVDDGSRGNIAVPAGGNVFVSFVGAAKDPVMFPSPESVNPERPFENYIHYGEGAHQCLGKEISMIAMQSMLKVVGGLDNLRRAKGPRGELKKIPREGGFYIYMTEDGTGYFPFPTTMRVNWDGKLPSLPKRA